MRRNRQLIPYAVLLALSLSTACAKTKPIVLQADNSPVEFIGKCQEGDCQNGPGTLKLDGGGQYVGGFLQGKFNEQGMLTLPSGMSFTGNFRFGRYEGGAVVMADGKKGTCLKGTDCLNGTGQIKLEDKTVYEGRFRLGLLEGHGFITTPEGKTYKGLYLKNKLEGSGSITSTSGSSATGLFKDGKLYGEVMIIFKTGSKFTGIFKDGEYAKDGVLSFPNNISGKCLAGNCIDGIGTLIISDGSSYQGGFKDCRKHGNGVFTSPDGAVYKGEYKEGKRNGLGTYIFPSGIKYTGTYKNDQRDGKGLYFFANGKSHSVTYENGVLKSE